MREFDWIARHFAPLADGEPGALDLKDDAAILPGPGADDLIVTMDAMVAGRHFLPDDPPDLVARKLIRVNLSDLAAMGAKPAHLFLATAFPHKTDDKWLSAFAKGLALDLAAFGCVVAGGDTVATDGPLTLSLTALGHAPKGTALKRSGAQPGDLVFVSGTIGDGGLGLKAAQSQLKDIPRSRIAWLADRYRLPQPRLDLGYDLRGLASACMDISDGLVQDAGHIARGSGVAVTLEADKLPLSAAARDVLDTKQAALADLLCGGDDYELLFTVPQAEESRLLSLALSLGLSVTRIGSVAAGTPMVQVHDASGAPMSFAKSGYSHF